MQHRLLITGAELTFLTSYFWVAAWQWGADCSMWRATLRFICVIGLCAWAADWNRNSQGAASDGNQDSWEVSQAPSQQNVRSRGHSEKRQDFNLYRHATYHFKDHHHPHPPNPDYLASTCSQAADRAGLGELLALGQLEGCVLKHLSVADLYFGYTWATFQSAFSVGDVHQECFDTALEHSDKEQRGRNETFPLAFISVTMMRIWTKQDRNLSHI